MKTTSFLVTILIGIFFFFHQANAQKANYTTRSGITLGFGVGSAYQQSDILNSRGIGYDFSFGSQLYKKEGALLSADWKFRFLAGENKAYDHRINPDGTFSNIDYRFFTYDLEFGLCLNRLRERTRIVVSGFAGGGITHGRTFADLYDLNNELYDYSSIDPFQDRKQVNKALIDLSDGDFETLVVNRAALLPTAGIYIGYQFSPSFSLGIEHKTNFYLTENNSVTGMDIDNRILSGSAIDMNHYTTLGFVWKIGRMTGGGGRTERQLLGDTPDVLWTPIVPVTPAIPETPSPSRMLEAPVVEIFMPETDPYITSSSVVTIKAGIENPGSYDNIFFFHNNTRKAGFSYNNYSHEFTVRAELEEGENDFRVAVKNEAGSAEDRVLVILAKQVAAEDPRIIETYPTGPVSGQPEIIYVTPTYTPAPNSSVTVREQPQIIDTTPERTGTAPENPKQRDERPCQAPVITLTGPGRVTTQNRSYIFTAGVDNIYTRNQVKLMLNGNLVNSSLNGRTLSYTAALNPGTNYLEVTAANECGSDSRTVSVTLIAGEPCREPEMQVNLSPVSRSDATHELKGTIRNVKDRQDITLTVNGVQDQNFQFDPSTGAVSARFRFTPGTNTVVIYAGNDCGSDNRSLSAIVAEPCRHPEIQVSLVEVNRTDATHELKGTIRNITAKENITLTVNGTNSRDFQFSPATGAIIARFRFSTGTNTVEVSTGNDCGNESRNLSVNVAEPCREPELQISLVAVNRTDATHELKGTIRNITGKENITLIVNGRPSQDFQFTPVTGTITAGFRFNQGVNTVEVKTGNDCGYETRSLSAEVKEREREEESSAGVRINPGNASWQFCLVTPRGTYTRDDLENKSFTYSGPASSLFILPTAGGGDALVEGRTYHLNSGQYYLFSGRLRVTVSSSHPGSMGQWWVSIESDNEPLNGNGNKRPVSPCEGR